MQPSQEMMNCRNARYWIHRHLDGDIPSGKRARLAAHLTRCPECREIERQLAAIQSSLRQLAEPVCGLGEVGPCELTPARQRANGWIAAAVAAVLVAGVGLWLVGQRMMTPDGSRTVAEHAPGPVAEPQPNNVLVAQDRPHESNANVQQAVDRQSSANSAHVHVRVRASSDDLVVPLPAKNPNVSIFWIYPTVKTVEAPDQPAVNAPSAS
jgi:anti-sigma factor RsiW